MEGLVVMLIVYFVIRAFASKGKVMWQSIQEQVVTTEKVKQPQVSDSRNKKLVTSMSVQTARQERSTEGELRYQPIQPLVQVNRATYGISGSMSGDSREGTASTEGKDTCDPVLSHDRIIIPTSYSLTQPESEMPGLTLSWDSNSLIQGIIMNEVLKRPRRWGDNHG